MKKALVILVLLTMAATVFALDVSADAQLSSSVFNPAFESGLAMPKLGVGFDLGRLELLANMALWIKREKELDAAPWGGDVSTRLMLFGMYFGAAPKLPVVEKLHFTFPIYMKVYIIGNRWTYSKTAPDGRPKTHVSGAFGFDAGARAYYNITEKWSAFLGFQAELFSFYGKGRATSVDGKKSDGDTINMYWFDTGTIDLGIKYTF